MYGCENIRRTKELPNRQEDLLKTSIWNMVWKMFAQDLISKES